jgi:hypothetical protein
MSFLILTIFVCSIASAATNTKQIVSYGDKVTFFFDNREWKLGASNATTNIYYEYVTDGQTVDNWHELATLQIYKGIQKNGPADVPAKILISQLYQECGDKLTYSVIKDTPTDCMIEWKVNGHPTTENQHEIDRFIIGKETLVILHYVKKTKSLTIEERQKWIDILNMANVEPIK